MLNFVVYLKRAVVLKAILKALLEKTYFSNEPSKAILNDSYKYLLSKFIPGIIGLLFVSAFTRVAGLSEYGKYSLLISQFNLVAALSYGWLIQSQLRYGSLRDNIEKPNILNLILFCSLITVPFIVLFNHLTPKLNLILLLV